MGCLTKGFAWFKELALCHLCFAVTFLTAGIIVDAIQALLFLILRPFSPKTFRRLNYYVTYALNSQLVFLVEWWSGSKVFIYGDPKVVKEYFGNEHALLLLNHSYEVDWLMGWVVCDRCRLLGNAKVYVKKMLQYAPVIGWSWKFQEIVFLERNWEKDKKSLGTQLTCLVNYPDPFWLVLFPEGTRLTKEKYEASMLVARQKGLPELKHHLLPRTRGFVASVHYLREKVPAIYDVTVAFPKSENEPTVYNILKGRPVVGYLSMRRIPIDEVPKDPDEAALWLHKLYQEKDKAVDNFLATEKFDPKGEIEHYKNFEYIELPRRYYSLLNISCWATMIIGPLLYFFFMMLTSGSYFNIAMVLIIVAGAYYGMYKLISLTKISQSASSYGALKGGDQNGHKKTL